MPKWVCVFPTSTTSSIGDHYARRGDGDDATQALRAARLAPVRRRRSRAGAEVDRLRPRRPAAFAEPAASARCATAARPCPACASTASGSSARARSCAASTSSRRAPAAAARPAAPPTRRCSRPSAGATRSSRSVPRRMIDVAFLRRPAAMESYAGDAKLPLPTALLRPALPLTARLMAIKNKANDESRPRRPRGAARAARPHRRLDRRRAARRRAARTPPTCRSAARSACC